ncbi:unnamed protein product [Gongylonema pulchrum]|uniref:FCP1 homology domain-containing protein n=1 Tax=Gongylonema pulchrum TaxID=637853 RepID=A0A183D9X1_9BILA|nr:unnamed protein product [Gongylonema pulchrum]
MPNPNKPVLKGEKGESKNGPKKKVGAEKRSDRSETNEGSRRKHESAARHKRKKEHRELNTKTGLEPAVRDELDKKNRQNIRTKNEDRRQNAIKAGDDQQKDSPKENTKMKLSSKGVADKPEKSKSLPKKEIKTVRFDEVPDSGREKEERREKRKGKGSERSKPKASLQKKKRKKDKSKKRKPTDKKKVVALSPTSTAVSDSDFPGASSNVSTTITGASSSATQTAKPEPNVTLSNKDEGTPTSKTISPNGTAFLEKKERNAKSKAADEDQRPARDQLQPRRTGGRRIMRITAHVQKHGRVLDMASSPNGSFLKDDSTSSSDWDATTNGDILASTTIRPAEKDSDITAPNQTITLGGPVQDDHGISVEMSADVEPCSETELKKQEGSSSPTKRTDTNGTANGNSFPTSAVPKTSNQPDSNNRQAILNPESDNGNNMDSSGEAGKALDEAQVVLAETDEVQPPFPEQPKGQSQSLRTDNASPGNKQSVTARYVLF